MDIRIIVLHRGHVVVGEYHREGEYCRLTRGYTVRRWGTSRGLGQLAQHGPTSSTKLDAQPETDWHSLTEIMAIKCRESVWIQELEQHSARIEG